MNIEKKEIVTIKDDNGTEIKQGDTVIFGTNFGTMIGVFGGINNNGTLIMGSPVKGVGKTVFFRPGSIQNIKVIELTKSDK